MQRKQLVLLCPHLCPSSLCSWHLHHVESTALQDIMLIFNNINSYLTRIVSDIRSLAVKTLHAFHSNSRAFLGPPLGVTTPSMNRHSHYVRKNEQRRSKHTYTFLSRCQKQYLTNISPKSSLFDVVSFS